MATSAGTIPINATFNGAQLEKDVLSALNRIQSKSTLNLNTRNFTQPLGKITGLANEFNKSLEASNARVVAFGASAGLIFAVQKSFSSLVNTTIEVEKSLTDINVVLNTSSKGIKQFGDQLFSVAKNTGSAFKDVASAATEFSRQGLGLEETLKRTRDALILTRLSGLDVVSSTEALTAAVNSFTKEALTTTDVVNKLAAVDAKFAVSSRDLSEAIQRVGSSASEAGVSFDELLGIVTSVQQTTARGGAVIGNALKTIFTRIERPQVISDLKDFGIAVTDISGNALPTIKVIENLAQSFQNLNPVIKSQVAELVGGVYQINILKAALAQELPLRQQTKLY
jgi:TP901 family phage tail tape measure protein